MIKSVSIPRMTLDGSDDANLGKNETTKAQQPHKQVTAEEFEIAADLIFKR